MAELWLDIGNSRLKWWLSPALDASPDTAGAAPHAGQPADAVAGLLADLQTRGAALDRAWLADVTGARHRAAIDAAFGQAGVPLARARTTPGLYGWQPAYADPARLGVDRFLMMLALCAEAPGRAFAVAAAGTALTFDAVDADGRHRGGVIAPGLAAAQQAVRGTTRFAIDAPDTAYADALGRDTEACVRQGAFHACAGLLDRLGASAPWRVLCGGDAPTICPHLRDTWEHRPGLLLDGLRAWARSLSSGGAAGGGEAGDNTAR